LLDCPKKAEKDEKAVRTKVKKAIEAGNKDVARIHAETAIRKKTESANYLRMSSRMDSVASRIQSAMMMKQTAKQMGVVTKGMDQVIKTGDLEKIMGVMDQFEGQVDTLAQQEELMTSAIGGAMASMTPENQIDGLLAEVGEEHGLDVSSALSANRVADVAPQIGAPAQAVPAQEDALAQRLAQLRSA